MDQFGVEKNSDGTYFKPSVGATLSWYDPSTGNYAYLGDTEIYDKNDYPTGTYVNGFNNNDTDLNSSFYADNIGVTGNYQDVSTAPKTSWFDILNTAGNVATSIWGKPQTTSPYPQTIYQPAPTASKGMSTGLIVFLVLAGSGVILGGAYLLSKGKK